MGKPRAILVDIIDKTTSAEDKIDRMNELERLLDTYGGFVVVRMYQKKQDPDYKTYIGSGKLDEIEEEALKGNVDYIIVNNILKPQQLYNLEERFEKHHIKVWDRIDLILEIFSKHATTKEAKLQIELAKLRHLGPRIYKMGGELMRQEGRMGTRGAGEANIEMMKRHIARQERKIKQDLKKIEKNQQQQRNKRTDYGFKTVSIVGYTNAGKSQLLTGLTNKKVKVKDELFATLDSRIGKVYLPTVNQSVLVSDTIGFIRDLPPDLIEAFHSTLAETLHSDLILHVIDIDDLDLEKKVKVVEDVLEDLDCQDKDIIYVFNKIDKMQFDITSEIAEKYKKHSPIFVSGLTKQNLEGLKEVVASKLKLS